MILHALLPILYVVTAALSAAGAWALVRWQDRVCIIDTPNVRSSHSHPKPRSGGLAIFLGLLLGGGLAWCGGQLSPASYPTMALMLGAALGFFLLGLADDIYGLPERYKLCVQLVLAIAVSIWGPRLHTLDIPGLSPTPLSNAAGIALSALWYVGFINAFNFMDGTDGIAAGEAALAGLVISLFGAGLLPLLASAAALGFLVFNYQPSRLFMGDGGSHLLGYLLAVSAVVGDMRGGGALPFGVFVLILGTFLIDTIVTFLWRAYRREMVFRAHRSHHYQKLTDCGWSHAQVFWLNIALTAALSLSAVVYAAGNPRMRVALSAGWLAFFGWGIAWIREKSRALCLLDADARPARKAAADGDPTGPHRQNFSMRAGVAQQEVPSLSRPR